MLADNFRKNLNYEMARQGLSIKKLSEAMNTSFEWVRMIRIGGYSPRLDSVEKFAKALGVDPVAMLEEWEE